MSLGKVVLSVFVTDPGELPLVDPPPKYAALTLATPPAPSRAVSRFAPGTLAVVSVEYDSLSTVLTLPPAPPLLGSSPPPTYALLGPLMQIPQMMVLLLVVQKK